jgi:zinc and cadmium transporter
MDYNVWIYSLASVIFVSLLSLLGIFTIYFKKHRNLKKFLIYSISFSAGALIGDAFIHLIPEVVEEAGGFSTAIAFYIIAGIAVSFLIEKVIRWRHSCHHHHVLHNGKKPHRRKHEQIKPFALMNLFGDAIHNIIDGIIIAASYLASIPVGIATTIAVVLHEIPQEVADFGVLIHGGLKTKKALFLNYLTALGAVIGTIGTLMVGKYIEGTTVFLLPFSAGAFIYIAGSDLIPELQKEAEIRKSLTQFGVFLLGIAVMASLLFLE